MPRACTPTLIPIQLEGRGRNFRDVFAGEGGDESEIFILVGGGYFIREVTFVGGSLCLK